VTSESAQSVSEVPAVYHCMALQVMREIVTLERMHRAFDSGLMEYGMAKAVKKAPVQRAAAELQAMSSAA